MTTQPIQEDLFGNPVDVPAPPVPSAPVRPVNDMDRVQAVLAEIVGDTAALLHVDDAGRVRRCAGRGTDPVSVDLAAVIEQLLAARYLTTQRRSCPGHGSVITATRAGRDAVCRWRAYRRPSTWGPTPGPDHHHTNRKEN
jgi:hypothetical protein